jgi:hypothetical protein
MENRLMTTDELVEAYRQGVHGVFKTSRRRRHTDMLPVTLVALVTLLVSLWAF